MFFDNGWRGKFIYGVMALDHGGGTDDHVILLNSTWLTEQGVAGQLLDQSFAVFKFSKPVEKVILEWDTFTLYFQVNRISWFPSNVLNDINGNKAVFTSQQTKL